MPSPTFPQNPKTTNANNELVFEVLVPPSPTETATQQPLRTRTKRINRNHTNECPLPSPTYDSDESSY
ncbi:12140_t:CDS:2 [Cetraspora pellucida]|uniref:12140_t:CDS:1 n=1 Tax=Cetraspora pellucida TaxID=1433469 RepID=A0A9N8VPY0_9GLOM|nr:12140_t:CDS:2 [Cetraspora pellucida]